METKNQSHRCTQDIDIAPFKIYTCVCNIEIFTMKDILQIARFMDVPVLPLRSKSPERRQP